MVASAELLEGKTLQGKRHNKTWTVVRKIGTQPDHTPGNFSVGYQAQDDNGNRAFVKASDASMFIGRDGDTLKALTRMANAHTFERDVLDFCHGNAMDRIVLALDYGDILIENEGFRDNVFYLVFELAEGDIRRHVTQKNRFDLLFCTTMLHNIFVATRQLHSANVAHNDLKPANALVINDELQKIGDLGRATRATHPAPHDSFLCAGDPRYAPPEQLYPPDPQRIAMPRQIHREVGDLYNLGSVIHYVLTARMMTPEVIRIMRPETRPPNLTGGSLDSFDVALPYWRDAFSEAVMDCSELAGERFGPGVEGEIKALRNMVLQLCEPDPIYRGHPRNRTETANPRGLERYISELDFLKKKLAIKAA